MPDPEIRDTRRPLTGGLPKSAQTWFLGGIALCVLLIAAFTGNATPPATSVASFAVPPPQPVTSTERVEAIRAQLQQSMERAQQPPDVPPPPVLAPEPEYYAPRDVDPLDEERRRREYESLFASSVVSSAPREATPAVQAPAPVTSAPPPAPEAPPRPGDQLVYEGTLIEGVLTNRLEGQMSGPVNVMVTTPTYSHTRALVIPAGARVLGRASAVNDLGDERLAVAFHRLILPNGRSLTLEQFTGLNAVGATGLKDRVNSHWLSTFGASAVVGLLSGFSNFAGSGFSRDRGTTVVFGGATDTTAQTTAATMNRYLNRLPTITIREGHRIRVWVANDLYLPAYE